MDVEKTMQFILETQAQHDERFLQFREQTEERFRSLVDVTLSLGRHGEETDRRFRRELQDCAGVAELADAPDSKSGAV